ncbi:hypothetical protein DFH09DRAFT_1498405 [Mycena vulgaris]|nr:hypothetical protein DFH09DRAFT_1498405 [Mycena vulgaris]
MKLTVSIQGSAITLIGYVWNLNESHQADIFISIDNATEVSQGTLKSGYYPWYQSPALANGFHTLGLRAELPNISFSSLAFDHAIVNITTNDLIPEFERDAAIFDDKDSSIAYSGSGWNPGGSVNVYRYQNTTQWTNTTNSTFSIPFNGVGITVVAAVDEGQVGNYTLEYYIDSSAIHVVDVTWPTQGLTNVDLSVAAGGIITLLSDATLPGNHTLQIRLASSSGNLPLAIDYVVVTEALPSDGSWYHPSRNVVLIVPVVWAALNILSLVLFRGRIVKFWRGWKIHTESVGIPGRKPPEAVKAHSAPDPMTPHGSDIQLIPVASQEGQHEKEPLIPTQGYLPSGLTDAYYDKGDLQALYTPYTLWISLAFGLILISAGIAVRIISSRGIVGGGREILQLANRPPFDEAQRDGWVAASMTSIQRSIFSICITFLLTVITGFISTPRATLLKWALAREGRLEFNSSSNFFISAGGLFSSTGTIATSLYALATVLTFASAGFITVPFDLRDGIEGSDNRHLLFSERYYVVFHHLPLIITGLCVSLQALLTLASYREYTIPTWSSQPFDVAAAAFSLGLVSRTEGRCLADVDSPNRHAPLPMRPSRIHPRLADVRPALTLLPPAGILLGTSIFALTFTPTLDPNHNLIGPTALNSASIAFTSGAPALALLAAFQAPLTVYFHALDVAERVVADEVAWRRAATAEGFHPSAGLAALRPGGRTILMFGSKVGIQWLYSNGIAFVVGAFPVRGPLSGAHNIDTMWHIGGAVTFVSFYLYLAGAFLTASAGMYKTFGDLGNFRTFQPAAYGHIQTLVNAIDDWSPVMYWGHKIGGEVCHAGRHQPASTASTPAEVYVCLEFIVKDWQLDCVF